MSTHRRSREVGRAQIVILALVVVVMIVAMMLVMVPSAAQQDRTEDFYAQTNASDPRGRPEGNADWLEQP